MYDLIFKNKLKDKKQETIKRKKLFWGFILFTLRTFDNKIILDLKMDELIF